MHAANTLAAFLRDRRTRLDPAAFGLSGRRRTPGLRREEIVIWVMDALSLRSMPAAASIPLWDSLPSTD